MDAVERAKKPDGKGTSVSVILCPTRGGVASYPNQESAIRLARDRGAPLVFLHVSNVEFLGGTAGPVLVDIEGELEDMGEFLLEMAKDRARASGVEAEGIVRSGSFRQALEEVIREREIPTVVLGSSEEEIGVTTDVYLEKLAQSLVEDLGVEVYVLRQGEILRHETPGA